jgi:pSer/pThr/pTyr-binding forkhead associated (FHA) protein
MVEFEGASSQTRRTIACDASVWPASLPAWGRLGEHALGHNRVVVGRSKVCDLRLTAAEVSRRHALIFRQGGAVWIADLASANGTFVDGIRVERPAVVAAGAVVSLGSESLRFEPCPT